MGTSILVIVVVALVGGLVGQSFLNTNARNLTAAMNDATRVMEQIRQQNSLDREPCKSNGIPTLVPVDASGNPVATSWNAWLDTQGKSIRRQDATSTNLLELVAVTCQDEDGGATASDYCSTATTPSQVGAAEWKVRSDMTPSNIGAPPFNPLRVTVAVGWSQDQRVIGGSSTGAEFTSSVVGCGKGCTTQTLTVGPDQNSGGVIGVIESQAMVTSLVTCR